MYMCVYIYTCINCIVYMLMIYQSGFQCSPHPPHALSCGLLTSWCFEPPGRGGWAALSLSSCTEMLRVPTCLLSSPVVLGSLSEHVAPPGCEGRLPSWESAKQDHDHHCMCTENSRFLPTWDRTLHARWDCQVSKTCVNYIAKPDPIMKSHKMEIKRKISLALCK